MPLPSLPAPADLLDLTAQGRDGTKVGAVRQVLVPTGAQTPAWVLLPGHRTGPPALAPLAGAEVRGDRLVLACTASDVLSAPPAPFDGVLDAELAQSLCLHYGLDLDSPAAGRATAVSAAGGSSSEATYGETIPDPGAAADAEGRWADGTGSQSGGVGVAGMHTGAGAPPTALPKERGSHPEGTPPQDATPPTGR